jgi:hypothetical protein
MTDSKTMEYNSQGADVSKQQTAQDWADAAAFVDSLVIERATKFDSMTRAEIKLSRLASRGLVDDPI